MNIQNEIIKTLRDASGHPLLLSVLRSQVNARLRPVPLKALFDDALKNLQGIGYILETPNELDAADPYYILDERGEAYSLQKRL